MDTRRCKYKTIEREMGGVWELTAAKKREGTGVAEDRPEVETIDRPKERKEKESKFEESACVCDRFFLR